MKYWFKRRRYGYGWIPSTWEGWLSIAVWVVLLILLSAFLLQPPEAPDPSNVIIFSSSVFIMTAALVWLAAAKGPKAKWRWGAKPDDNPEEDF